MFVSSVKWAHCWLSKTNKCSLPQRAVMGLLPHGEPQWGKETQRWESCFIRSIFKQYFGGFTREIPHRWRVVLENVHLVNHPTSEEEQRTAISLSNSTQSSRNVSHAEDETPWTVLIVPSYWTLWQATPFSNIPLNHIFTQTEQMLVVWPLFA